MKSYYRPSFFVTRPKTWTVVVEFTIQIFLTVVVSQDFAEISPLEFEFLTGMLLCTTISLILENCQRSTESQRKLQSLLFVENCAEIMMHCKTCATLDQSICILILF